MLKNIYLVLTFVLLLLLNNACTVLGGLTGSIFNNSEYSKEDREVLDMKKGKSLEVHTMNREIHKGNFVRMSKLTQEEYSNKYMDFLNTRDSVQNFPQLNEKYFINQQVEPVEFKGLDFGKVIYSSKSFNGIKSIAMDSIAFLKNMSGQKIQRKFILSTISSSKIPLYSQLILSNEGNMNEIRSEDIYKIVSKNITGTVIGAIIGAIIDIAVISSLHLKIQ